MMRYSTIDVGFRRRTEREARAGEKAGGGGMDEDVGLVVAERNAAPDKVVQVEGRGDHGAIVGREERPREAFEQGSKFRGPATRDERAIVPDEHASKGGEVGH